MQQKIIIKAAHKLMTNNRILWYFLLDAKDRNLRRFQEITGKDALRDCTATEIVAWTKYVFENTLRDLEDL